MEKKIYQYSSITRFIKVIVKPYFEEELSVSDENNYVWQYDILIENLGKEEIQLVSRYWKIVDSGGTVKEIEGEGVVGQKPILKPGEKFNYSSHANLRTPSGIMLGKFRIISKNEEFEIAIPAFSLDSPNDRKVLN